jgi:O-succinylbenzoic acid--CoA ligase
MKDWLSISASANPNALALLYEGQAWRYHELDREVSALRAGLQPQGIQPGQHIAVLMPNTADTVILIHALIRLGGVLVPLNTRLTAEEIAFQVANADCAALIYDSAFSDKVQSLDVQKIAFADLDATGTQTVEPQEIDLNDPHAILFTSGTTGQPKGVMLTYSNHFWSATASAFRIGTLPEDRWLCCLPLYHVGGLNILFRCCLYGTAIVLHNGFDVDKVLHSIQDDGVTLASLVPTQLYRLMGEIENRSTPLIHHLRLVLLGGAAATPELVIRGQALSIPVATTYGMTETDSQVATQTPEATQVKPGSVGRALPFSAIRVMDDDGKALETDQIGEIVVSGPTIMREYFRNEQATRKALQEGWLHTGDLGYFDSDGDLWIVQRRSDLIISGGENVYPAEVESLLRQHSAVEEVCVIGLPDAEWGQRITAAVILKSDTELTQEVLIAFAREHLAGYKVPRVIRFVDALPLTSSGKVERKSVAALFE